MQKSARLLTVVCLLLVGATHSALARDIIVRCKGDCFLTLRIDGAVYNADDKRLGWVSENGVVKDNSKRILGSIDSHGVIRDYVGKLGGTMDPSGTLRIYGEYVGAVDNDGTIRIYGGRVWGEADGSHDAVDARRVAAAVIFLSPYGSFVNFSKPTYFRSE